MLAEGMNQLVTEIAKLNVQIVEMEQGGTIVSDAVGLRDKRDKALEDLAKIVNIQVDEQKSGAVNVFVGGDYLVFDGATQLVKVVEQVDRGLSMAELRLTNTDARLRASSGELAGLITARDDVLGGFLDDLDSFTGSLDLRIQQTSRVGAGAERLRRIGFRASDRSDRRAAGRSRTGIYAGARFVSGGDREQGQWPAHDARCAGSADGMADDTTYESLIASLDAIDGLSAQLLTNGHCSCRVNRRILSSPFRMIPVDSGGAGHQHVFHRHGRIGYSRPGRAASRRRGNSRSAWGGSGTTRAMASCWRRCSRCRSSRGKATRWRRSTSSGWGRRRKPRRWLRPSPKDIDRFMLRWRVSILD